MQQLPFELQVRLICDYKTAGNITQRTRLLYYRHELVGWMGKEIALFDFVEFMQPTGQILLNVVASIFTRTVYIAPVANASLVT
jgi:hypothetical protein